MRICVPTRDTRGLSSWMSEHFANAPYLTIVDTESGELEVVSRSGHRRHESGTHHAQLLSTHRVDAVVCGDMGKRALQALRRAGIDVFVSDARAVQSIVEDVRGNRLRPMLPDQAGETPERAARPKRGRSEERRLPHGREAVGRATHGPGPGHRPRQLPRTK